MTDSKRLALRLRDFVETYDRTPSAQERHELEHQVEIEQEAEQYDPPAPGSSPPEPERRSLLSRIVFGGK